MTASRLPEQVGSTYMECEWVLVDEGTLFPDALHLILDAEVAWVEALANYGRADTSTHPRPALTGCGITTAWMLRPTVAERTGAATRCAACCSHAGYPEGAGSPTEDDRCRGQLTARLALSGLSLPVAIVRRSTS